MEIQAGASQLGLRDFLFYLVPGSLFLGSAVLLSHVNLAQVRDLSGFGASILGVLLAYFAGQVCYGLTYPLRNLLGKKSRQVEDSAEFTQIYIWVIEEHPTLYSTEVVRYRSFARFSIAMVFPSLLLGISITSRLAAISLRLSILSLLCTILIVVSFIYRYRRYDKIFCSLVLTCRSMDWSKFEQGEVRGVEG
jgi:hypothetical protein